MEITNKIEIDFIGGLHGNFLCYAINTLANTETRTINPFTIFGTSHVPYTKKIAESGHYSAHPDRYQLKTKNIISIMANLDDCLLINLLNYGRAGDFNFDLKNFHINFYDQLKNTTYSETIEHINQAYGIDIKQTNTISRGILREYYHFNFKNYNENNIIKHIKKQKYEFDVFKFNFTELYKLPLFLELMNRIVEYFNLDYTVDVEWYTDLWERFIATVDEIAQNKQAHYVLNSIIDKKLEPIDFNLLQEAWLNARLSILYDKEMPYHQEQYFQNTAEIIEYLNI